MERLTEKTKDCFGYRLKDGSDAEVGFFKDYDAFFSHNMVVKALGEYEDLEEQGLLLRFLCKVGDTVFFHNKRGETILPVTIENIHLAEGKCCIEYFGWFFNGYGEPTMGFTFTENDFGKTVFLTKKEAEAKLREMEVGE